VFNEYYQCGVADYYQSIDEALGLGYPPPELAYVDSSAAMLRGALSQRNIYNAGATHRVSEGIRNVRRLILDGQGTRLLRIHPRCVQLIGELQSYLYNDRSTVAQGGEPVPLKLDDHGPDALRYMAWRLKNT
jgi:hypothetical protein